MSTPRTCSSTPSRRQQLDDGQPNRIRTPRRPRRKHPVLPIVRGRRSQQIIPAQFFPGSTIKLPDDEKMRKAFDVGKPRLKLRQNLEYAIDVVFSAETLGNLFRVLVRTAHKSNRPAEVNIVAQQPSISPDRAPHPKTGGCPVQVPLGRGSCRHGQSYGRPRKIPAQAELGRGTLSTTRS